MNVNALEIIEPRADHEAADEQPVMDRLQAIVESLLFAAAAPVPLARLVQALDGHDRREVAAAVRRLAETYEREGRGLRVVEVAGGYQIRTVPEHGPWVRRLLGGKPPRLSRPMLETLAIIAYRQPCTRPEIEAIRGVDVDAVVTTLLERRMIRMVGRKDAPGRPILYGTTPEFLEVFGLPDLDALPPLRDLGEMADILRATDLSVTSEGVVPTEEASAGERGDAFEAPDESGDDS
ncbi:MAG TPA: SMC-Scp complex subunit ScpB [Candidatus Limnocylindria bacterium]|nr:SMC-Scp complex subunit ScpB [Candidatus Limnocylindria bacterium]